MKKYKILKKIFCIILVLSMMFSLCACFNPPDKSDNDPSPTVSATPSGKEPSNFEC